MTPVHKSETVRIKSSEREALITTQSPARGRISFHAIRLIGEAAKQRKMDSRFPGALRINRTAVAGIMLMEPVRLYDETQPDLYEIKWTQGNRAATINLIHILEPLRLTVRRGYACEIPLSLPDPVEGAPSCLVLHLHDAVIRASNGAEKSEPVQTESEDAS